MIARLLFNALIKHLAGHPEDVEALVSLGVKNLIIWLQEQQAKSA